METTATLVHEKLGHSIWYDNIRRGLLRSGELARLVREGVRGVTSNPTIFEKAIGGSTDYDDALRRLVAEAASVSSIYYDLVVEDIREAADVLRPIYEDSKSIDGYVSVEVEPDLADDAPGTVAEARKLAKTINRDNVMIKVPATEAGCVALTDLIAAGVSVNVTLIFSVERYQAVAEAYLKGLEARASAGQPLGDVASVASFFVSRIDTAVDRALQDRIAAGKDAAACERLLGKIAIANAKTAYTELRRIVDSDRFQKLAEKGAQPQRLLWASTGTKNPLYRDTLYVDSLIGELTVNTVPPATLTAFLDHGEPARTVTRDVDEARTHLSQLGEVGVDLDRICDDLLAAGLSSFSESMARLRKVIEARREALLEAAPERQKISPGTAASPVLDALRTLGKQEAARRLWSIDPTLFTSDPSHEASIKNRLGWLSSPELMSEQVDDLVAFAKRAYKDGLKKALLLGMGGSSLCAEVLARTYGSTPGFLELRVLDSTDPEAVSAAAEWADPTQTLFVVASKSGSTIEVRSFEAFFWERARSALGDAAGSHFVAITDPDTELGAMASEKGYRRTFENPRDIGGRYSAVSFFGLVPAALLGADVEALVDDAERMAVGCASVVPADDNPGVRLGAFIGGLARAGRDKLTLVASPSIEPLGSWIEQLVAESTGKMGRGVVPIDREPVAAPDSYGADRAFVYLRHGGRAPTDLDRQVDGLIAAGHPVACIGLLAKHDLGGEFFRWEVATAIAGSLLGVNPFDEPNVTEAKLEAGSLIEAFERDGRLTDFPAVAPDDASIESFIAKAGEGDYVVLSAFFHRTEAREDVLTRIRSRIRSRLKVATTVGYGPRFLHSTGQLHKGGPSTGVFLVLTSDAVEDVPIPDRSYSFGVLRAAQALGDLEVLERRGRRALRVHLGTDVDGGLARLDQAIR